MKRALLLALLAFNVQAQTVQIAGDNGRPLSMSNGGVPVDLKGAISGEDTTLNQLWVSTAGTPKNMTATGAIKDSAGELVGVFVSASTSCTIQVHDNASAASGTVIVDTTASITAPTYLPIPAKFANGAYFTEGGTCNVTFYYR
jgi:hypothetical protein